MPVKVGIVDSGVDAALGAAVGGAVCVAADAGAAVGDGVGDGVGHGTAVARIILALAPQARLFSARAFAAGRHGDAASVVRGIHWCLAQQARVVNLSLGLREDRDELRAACAAAADAGAIVVTACPARGAAVYPAAYAQVLAVSGDARCAAGNWSVLEPRRRYGAAPLAADAATPGGASFAAARVSGLAAAFLAARPQARPDDFRNWLDAQAAFHGRERRQAA
ncbi:MAG: S8 family serine peptidase [Rhodocyclaceae bacterium]|nr:S8 family serine peptidase [Rhodocyclaceae bacterium]